MNTRDSKGNTRLEIHLQGFTVGMTFMVRSNYNITIIQAIHGGWRPVTPLSRGGTNSSGRAGVCLGKIQQDGTRLLMGFLAISWTEI